MAEEFKLGTPTPLLRSCRPLAKPQQRVLLLSRTQHENGFAGEVFSGQRSVDVADLSVVDVGPALLDHAAGFAFAFREAGLDERFDELQPGIVQPRRRQRLAW